MPHVKTSLEERLEKLARHCADHNTPMSLYFDPEEETWSGALDGTGWSTTDLGAQEYSGDLEEVLEAFESELGM